MSKIRHELIVDYSQLFPDEPIQDLQTYLKGIDKHTLLSSASYLLAIRSQNSKVSDFRTLLRSWFSGRNQEFINKIYASLIKLEKEYGNLSIVNPESSLQFFEFCFENLPDQEHNQEINNEEIEKNIFKAYLTLNQKTF